MMKWKRLTVLALFFVLLWNDQPIKKVERSSTNLFYPRNIQMYDYDPGY